jgi:hypothetical protein
MRLVTDKKYETMWKSKIPTYGPFVLLLTDHIWNSSNEITTVYRGTDLPEELIEQFRHPIKSRIHFRGHRFLAFTSTTRNKTIAEFYAGNTLFHIKIHSQDGDDVSSHSKFPEEEYLLRAGFDFCIRSCIFAEDKNRWIVHLQSYRANSKEFHSRNGIRTVKNDRIRRRVQSCEVIYTVKYDRIRSYFAILHDN